MERAEKLYDADYCMKINKKPWRYKIVPGVVKILYEHFKPCSVVDFGCANGLHIANFKNLGLKCFGIEGSIYYRRYIEENYDGDYVIADLRVSFDLEKTFDLAICIEVLEHIDSIFEKTAVENICKHSNILCVTVSPVTNARYHVNGHEKEYWIKIFESIRNFRFEIKETKELQNKFKKMKDSPSWMRENLMIFRRIEN